MALRIAPSILGKRTLRELYSAPQQAPIRFLRPCALTSCFKRRGYATVAEVHRSGRDSGPPPGFPPPQNSERRTSNSSSSPSGSRNNNNKTNSSTRASSSSSSSSRSQPHTPSTDSSSSSRSRSHSAPEHGPKQSSDDQIRDWERNPDLSISKFSELPEKNFGVNQHIVINEEFKEALRQILWQFKAPIRYAFAYGSGVFPQGKGSSGSISRSTLHPSPPEAIQKVQDGSQKMIDFIFGVSYTQHWHSLNLQEHRDHYSGVGSLGSYAVSKVQDSFGAGCYFNPYITVNGTLIKYGVVNIDTLCRDLSEWNTLYLAGRLHKPVKILRDNAAVRYANQINLISAVRTALLLLPPDFTEQDLYATIAGISYMGDPRMTIGGDDPRKVHNIVQGQLANFRRLYAPLIDQLPNISFNDSACTHEDWLDDPSINARLAQDMDPVKRGNMVRRLPKAFREKLYFEYQSKFRIPRGKFNEMLEASSDDDKERIKRREGGEFEQRIAKDSEGLRTEVKQVIEKTIRWSSSIQSLKGIVTAGWGRSWRYASEKRAKNRASEQKRLEEEGKEAGKADGAEKEKSV